MPPLCILHNSQCHLHLPNGFSPPVKDEARKIPPISRVSFLFAMKTFRLTCLAAYLLALVPMLHAAPPATAKADPAESLPAIALNADPLATPIVPWPMRGEVGGARIIVPPTARIVATTPQLVPLAEVLASQILRLSGRLLPHTTGEPAPGDIALRITPGLTFKDDPYLQRNPELKGLESRLFATPKGCLIEGVDYQATALATATLLQCLEGIGPALSYPPLNIEDKPGSTYRALMLDIAREWHPAESLRDLIDLCQFYKVPYFHLHITDDQGYRLPSKAFPGLPSTKGSYTEQELRDLVAYGDTRGVTLVPELEMPAHSTAIQKFDPALFGAMDDATGNPKALGVLNMANPDIYPALEKLIVETCDIFKSSPYFHIGGDEANFGQFNKNPYVQKQLAELEAKEGVKKDQVFGYFVNRINAIVKKQGKRTICWEGFGAKQNVDKDVIVYLWHGQSHSPQSLLGLGHRLVNTPWHPSVYGSVRKNYEWNMWNLNLNEHGASRQFDALPAIIGGGMLLWQRGPDEALQLLRTKTPARLERLYSPYARLDYDHFAKRLARTDATFTRLVHPLAVKLEGTSNTEENLASGSVKVAAITHIPGAKIRYVINAPEVTSKDAVYSAPIEVGTEHSKRGSGRLYDGPRSIVRLQVFDAKDQPLGGEKIIEIRHDVPRIDYSVRALPTAAEPSFPEDISKLTVLKAGRLASFDGSQRLETGNAPRLFEARATLEVRTPGSYQLSLRRTRTPMGHVRMRFGDGPWIQAEEKEQKITVELPVGSHPVVVQQIALDENIGISASLIQPPKDPSPKPRNFYNRAIHYWLTPL
jgi:hexosaminidase